MYLSWFPDPRCQSNARVWTFPYHDRIAIGEIIVTTFMVVTAAPLPWISRSPAGYPVKTLAISKHSPALDLNLHPEMRLACNKSKINRFEHILRDVREWGSLTVTALPPLYILVVWRMCGWMCVTDHICKVSKCEERYRWHSLHCGISSSDDNHRTTAAHSTCWVYLTVNHCRTQ